MTPTNHFETIRSFAKLNLRLKVVGRQAQYHLLYMINAQCELNDEIDIQLLDTPEEQLIVSFDGQAPTNGLLDPNKNLACQAARLFFDTFQLPYGISLHLRKHIPIGGGLGGGSGNAAAVLQWLSMHFLIDGDQKKKVAQLSLRLGADVPYCLRGGLQEVTGIGEKVQPLHLSDTLQGMKLPVLLFIPPEKLSTQSVFEAYALKEETLPDKEDQSLNIQNIRVDYEDLLTRVDNDLMEAAFTLSPSLKSLYLDIDRIEAGKLSMSGSGSTFFLLPPDLNGFTQEQIASLSHVASKYGAVLFPTHLILSSLQ